MEKMLSPRELAMAIGASESSVKRWIDDGQIVAARTAGGHRRIPLREALAFIRGGGVTLVHPEVIGVPGIGDLSVVRNGADADALLQRAIVAGDLAAGRRFVLARYVHGEDLTTMMDGPLAGALHEVGAFWERGLEGIHQEHRATDACVHLVNFMRSLAAPVPADAPLAIGGAPAGDPYQVPSLMVATTLALNGWREVNFGANLPAEVLARAIEDHRPKLAWLSLTSPAAGALPSLSMLEAAAARCGAVLVLGGQSVPVGTRLGGSNLHHLPSMQALAVFARGLRAALPLARSLDPSGPG